MSGKIPCDVIRDLLPSYVDEITSETSNQLISEHLQSCEDCRRTLSSMKGGLAFAEKAEQERREIDFLRKTKKRTRRIVLGSIAGVLLLFAAVFAVRVFLVGERIERDWTAMQLKVEGPSMSFTAMTFDSAGAIAELFYEEEDGVVNVSARRVLASPLHSGTLSGSYTASRDIREVRAGERILWASGATVSPLASDLFAVRHDYVGDMPANNRLAQALSLSDYLGPFTNELETGAEPYGWRILLSDPIPAGELARKERDMDAFGWVILGLTGNLDHVTFVYTSEGEKRERSITKEEASAFLGEDIKNCGVNVRVLDALIQKSGLSLYAVPGKAAAEQEAISIRIINQTDTDLYSISCTFYDHGEVFSNSTGINADESAIKPGNSMWFGLTPEELAILGEDPFLEVSFSFQTPDGREIAPPGRLRIAAAYGTACIWSLTGSESEGYALS